MLYNINDLKVGSDQDIILLIKCVEQGKSQNGAYQRLMARDKQDHEIAIMNFTDKAVKFREPTVAKLRLNTQEYKGRVSYQLINYVPVEGAVISDYLPKSKVNQADSWNYLVNTSKNLRPCLHKLVGMVLSANSTEFKIKALGPYKAFSRRNGILEATVKLTKLADFASQILNLDRDLMLAGAMMYYVGYIDCMDDAFNITADDILIGAGTNAANRIKTQVQKILSGNDEQLKMSVDMTDVKLLCHMVMSRYKGIQPATAEAYALRYLDAMITEVDSVETALSGYESGSIITPLYGYGKLLKR